VIMRFVRFSRIVSLMWMVGCAASAPPPPTTFIAPPMTMAATTQAATQPGEFELYQVRCRARSVVIVCEASGDMLPHFDGVRLVLSNAIDRLNSDQWFNIVLFSKDKAISLSEGALLQASTEGKLAAKYFLLALDPHGGYDAVPAMRLAIRQQPEVIYLLTVGTFADNDAMMNLIASEAVGHVRINALHGESHSWGHEELMWRIASMTGGEFRFVPEKELRFQ
jgi:hypothetical protein